MVGWSISRGQHAFLLRQCLQNLAAGTSVLQSLTDAFSGGTGALLEGKLNDLKGLPESRLAWQAVKAEDGATYYYNKDTNETTWEEPEDMHE